MQSEGVSTTLVLTGMLPFIVLVAAALSLPLCFGLLRLYRSALLKGMATLAGSTPPAGEVSKGALPPAPMLAVTQLEPHPEATNPAVRHAARAPWRNAAVYAAGSVGYALAMTIGWLTATGEGLAGWGKLAILFWIYLWPAVLAVWMVAAYDRVRRWQLLGAYAAGFAGLSLVALARSPNLEPLQLPLLWLIMNGPSSVLLLTFLWRPIRAVGPLVVVFLLIVSVGSQSLLTVASTIPGLLEPIAELGFALGLGGVQVFWAMIAAGVGIFAALGWPLLRWIGRRYERKQVSEQSITIDALFLLFAVVQPIGLAFEHPLWIFTGAVAFAAYKAVTLLIRPALRAEQQPRTLLLLRVFRLGKRSEQLFDKLRKHWQTVGNITMIAGPDLATTTVEPHEFLDFLGGRLARRFVSNPQDLERRIAAMDRAPDPDGRYRINEFFCRVDTWQTTMQRLAVPSDAVLMDLRSFSPANQGCLFELESLLDGVDLARVVFLIDPTTDRNFLEASLHRLWRELSGYSPNREAAMPSARLFVAEEPSERVMHALLSHLLTPTAREHDGHIAPA